jgi:hypothetical protein
VSDVDLSVCLEEPLESIVEQLELLAADVGRLRRKATGSIRYPVDQIADRVEVIDSLAFPCSADLYANTIADTGATGELEREIMIRALAAPKYRQRKIRRLLARDWRWRQQLRERGVEVTDR